MILDLLFSNSFFFFFYKMISQDEWILDNIYSCNCLSRHTRMQSSCLIISLTFLLTARTFFFFNYLLAAISNYSKTSSLLVEHFFVCTLLSKQNFFFITVIQKSAAASFAMLCDIISTSSLIYYCHKLDLLLTIHLQVLTQHATMTNSILSDFIANIIYVASHFYCRRQLVTLNEI